MATIVSMSLGGGASISFNTEINKLVSRGVIVVTASGNDGMNACSASPGSAGNNINVGAHSEPQWSLYSGCRNPIESFSNWGKCVDVIAPGRKIMSVDYRHNKGKDFLISNIINDAIENVYSIKLIIYLK